MAVTRRLYSNARKRRMIRKIEKGAKLISSRNLIYSYGGGRSGNHIVDPPQSGSWTDCSGFASWLCEIAGLPLKNGAGSTWSLAEEGESGTSPWFTLFITNEAGEEHVIVRLRRRPLDPKRLKYGRFRWVECGGSDNPHLGDGPAFFNPPPERIAHFPIHRHFKEL